MAKSSSLLWSRGSTDAAYSSRSCAKTRSPQTWRCTRKLSLDETAIISTDRAEEFIALDDALTSLAEMDPHKSRIVEMKFFGGLNFEEVAEVEKVSSRTIRREWRKAKAWLQQEMQK